MKRAREILLPRLLLAVAGIGVLGCQSMDKPASASFASVNITGHTADQIKGATLAVFQQDGYSAVKVERANLVFEKLGSQWDRITSGNWIDDNAVWVRVRASVVPLSDGAFRLECQAFKVRDKGDAVFETEVRLRSNHSKPYQALLDRVLARLGP